MEALPIPNSFFGVVSLLFKIWLVWYVVSTWFSYRRLRHIPGPPLAALTSVWWTWKASSTRGHLTLADVCTQYGSIARLTPNTVITDDLDLYRKINGPKANNFTKGVWYKALRLSDNRDSLVSITDEEQHAELRKRLAPGYSGKDNPAAESTVDEVVLSFFDLLNRKYISVKSEIKPVDFAQIVQYFTLDVITYLSLGKPLGFVSEDTDKYNYIGSLDGSWPMIALFMNAPLLGAISRNPFVQRLLLPKVTDKDGLGKVKAVAKDIIASRFNGEKAERYDMVTSFRKHGHSQEEIVDESLVQIMAGSDTTATVLRTGLLSILSNPRIFNTLRAEIDAYCKSVSLPLDAVISNGAATKLPYLQACIKEALRHFPAGTGLLPRVVGPKGDTHKGVYLPPGTEVAQCIWNFHPNNTQVYGADATIFRPDRWLEASPEQLTKMEEAIYTIFGYGRFRCMGENIAKMELNKFWFELLRRYDCSLMNPQKPMTRNDNYALFVQKGMWMRVETRSDLEGK